MAGRPVTATGATVLTVLLLFPFSVSSAAAQTDTAQPKGGPKAAEEVFFDDFSGTQLDRDKWKVDVTGKNFESVNQEQQAYVDSPETIALDPNAEGAKNGALALQPRYKPGTKAPDGKSYDFVSGRLDTQDKFEFTHGSYSARIKLPENATASGLWPAWWSLGSKIDEGKPWPNNGEVDVMENVGEPWTNVSLHGPEYHGDTPITSKQHFDGGDPGGWHTYRADWTPDGFTFFVDDKQVYEISKQKMQENGWSWVYDDPQFLILNFALGGEYPQGVNKVTEPYFGLPQESVDKVKAGHSRLLVDWVRVTK